MSNIGYINELMRLGRYFNGVHTRAAVFALEGWNAPHAWQLAHIVQLFSGFPEFD